MGILWRMLGGEGGRVNRGGANPELQGLPLQGEMAHEVDSGGSYTASNGLNPQCMEVAHFGTT